MTIHSIDAVWTNGVRGGIDGIRLNGKVFAGPKSTIDKRITLELGNPEAAIQDISIMYIAQVDTKLHTEYARMKAAADLLRRLAVDLDDKATRRPNWEKPLAE